MQSLREFGNRPLSYLTEEKQSISSHSLLASNQSEQLLFMLLWNVAVKNDVDTKIPLQKTNSKCSPDIVLFPKAIVMADLEWQWDYLR